MRRSMFLSPGVFVISPPLLYGGRASAGIPANSILVFTVELVAVQ